MSVTAGVTESLRNPVARGILRSFLGSVWQVGFARSLGLNERIHIKSVNPRDMSLEAVFTVPENICYATREGEGTPFLPCGVTVALIDEITTLCMALADRKYRPGVSISLSCHMFYPVSPGERVTFKCQPLKMGARLGYGDAIMYREDGKLAARGRHVKHLPMGLMWDSMMQPLLYPLGDRLMQLQHKQMLKDPERTKAIPAGEHLLDMFKLENFNGFNCEESKTQSGDPDYGQGIGCANAEFLVSKRQCNYMPGTLHGGAIAVASEEIGRRCPPGNDIMVKYAEVHYMSPIKRRAGLTAVYPDASKGTDVTRVGLSEAGGAGWGPLCAEAVLLWGENGKL